MSFSSPKPLACLVMLALASGCVPLNERCRTSRSKVMALPRLVVYPAPQEGEVYFFDGLMYSEFEDSGLLSVPYARIEDLDEYKLDKFCADWGTECTEALLREETKQGKGFDLARLKAIVRFMGPSANSEKWSGRRCPSGVIQVEGIYRVQRVPESERPRAPASPR